MVTVWLSDIMPGEGASREDVGKEDVGVGGKRWGAAPHGRGALLANADATVNCLDLYNRC